MPFMRIKSVYIENNEETDDVIVVDAFVNKDDSIRVMEIFGYSIDNGKKWPFTIHKKKGGVIFDWGAGDEETISTINLFDKKAKVGEYFTRTDFLENNKYSYTYRVKEIFNWNDLG